MGRTPSSTAADRGLRGCYFRDKQLRQVLGFSGTDTTGAPREITPQVGDTFTVSEQWMDLDQRGNVSKVATQKGETLTFGKQPFTWKSLDAAAGDYVVGFIIEDLDGNPKVRVRSGDGEMMRSSPFRLFWLFAACALLAACVSVPAPGATPSPAPTATPQGAAQPKRLTILYTNDEHGWLAAQKNKDGSSTGGAAEMLGRWREQEGYTPDGPFLVLSGGDMWTGPAISTWFNGDSAAEVMNLMGYQAAAVGNHEFDFGLDVLARHAKDAKFPFLSANLVKKGTTEPPDFVRPYTVVDVDGVKVGIIGLTTRSTPVTTNPKNVAEFSFLPYADALARTIPEVKAAGADVIIALAHVCGPEMRLLAPQAKQLGVDVLTAGHCHERIAEEVAGLPLIGGGQYMQSYARLPLEIDAATRQVTAGKPEVIANRNAAGGRRSI